jgi:hypothetical protein
MRKSSELDVFCLDKYETIVNKLGGKNARKVCRTIEATSIDEPGKLQRTSAASLGKLERFKRLRFRILDS